MNVLSIQSSVAFGHVGNAAATLPLQRLGHEVWGVHTVQFSNHPGHGKWRGRVFPTAEVAEILAGIAEMGLLAECHAVLSGYLGEAATGDAILAVLTRAKTTNPSLVYCCDPVMGDDGTGLFVRPGIPEFFAAHGVPAADIVTPNRFELEQLTGIPVATLDQARAAARTILKRGPTQVLVSGLGAPLLHEGKIGTLLVGRDEEWLVTTPALPIAQTPKGTGDVLTALFLGHRLQGLASPLCLSKAVSAVYALIEAAAQSGLREMPLVAAQDRWVSPAMTFDSERI